MTADGALGESEAEDDAPACSASSVRAQATDTTTDASTTSFTKREAQVFRDSSRTRSRGWRAVVTLLAVNCLLLVPVWVALGQIGPFFVALEAGILVGLFVVLPQRPWSGWMAAVAGLAATSTSLLLLADGAAREALARPLNLYLDLRLIGAVRNLLDGAVGGGWGLVIIAGAALLTVGLGLALGGALAGLRSDDSGWRSRIPGLALLVACVVLVPLRWKHPRGVVFALPATQLVTEQRTQLALMLQERGRFAEEMAMAPSRFDSGGGMLGTLEGADVNLGFIESYGMAAVSDPRYEPIVRPALDALDAAAGERGLSVVSGALLAPSQGGMSWLGRGSMLSGLWLDNQLRYDLLVASDRHTLIDDFEAAGYRTVALMPAIQLAWPEGERFGYEEIHDFAAIEYAGPPLNWVTMPDQYVWSYLEQRIRPADRERPLFAEIGLISSHAPWTPTLELESWDDIGDGRIFQRWADAGEPPEELWRDLDRVREHYALSVRYALTVLASYVAEAMPEGVMLIALGDHQAAPLITGDDASRAVPVHVVASDAEMLAPFLELGFVPGAVPPMLSDAEVHRMSDFREWFVRSYSPTATLTQ